MDRRLCKCHLEPMHRNGVVGGTQRWRCSRKSCERSRRDYDNLSGVAYSRRRLKHRRVLALQRISRRAES